jgi:hypothetical protein
MLAKKLKRLTLHHFIASSSCCPFLLPVIVKPNKKSVLKGTVSPD